MKMNMPRAMLHRSRDYTSKRLPKREIQRRNVGNEKAAIYARVSTPDQHLRRSFTTFESRCEQRLRSQREYCDRGISGSKARRPGLDAMMADARRGEFSVILVAASTGSLGAPRISSKLSMNSTNSKSSSSPHARRSTPAARWDACEKSA